MSIATDAVRSAGALIVGAAAGGDGSDGRTLRARLATLRPKLVERALALTHDLPAAEDLAQDVVERALHAEERFRPGTNLGAWLNAIMRNAFIDERRHARFTVAVDVEIAWQAPERRLGPLDLLGFDDVMLAARLLDDFDRQILELAVPEHRSYREISRRMGIEVNTVGSRLFRVRKKLRPILQRVYQKRLQRGGARSPAE